MFWTRCEDMPTLTGELVATWFRQAEIERLLTEHASCRTDHGKKLWPLYTLFAVTGRREISPLLPHEPACSGAR
jgi:hypothetical protein